MKQEKTFNSTVAGQKAMCHNGFINATSEALVKLVDELHYKRFQLVEAWREGGKTDELWEAVDKLDVVIELQESTLEEIVSHKVSRLAEFTRSLEESYKK